MGLIFKDSDAPHDSKTARIWRFLFSCAIGIFALIGILALVLLAHDEVGSGFRMPRQHAMGLLSAAVVSGGLIMLLLGVKGKKQAMEASLKKTDQKPWQKHKDWAAGQIISSSRKGSWLLWICVLFWCGASLVISLAVAALQPNHEIRGTLLMLIFVIDAGVFFFAWRTTRAWRRFSGSIFEMPEVPAITGGALAGKIRVRGKLRPEHGWHLVLSCVRHTTSGPVNNLRTAEKILWQEDRWLRSDLPQADAQATGIPVFFPLPGDKPDSTPESGAGIHWRLEAWARLSGPDFHAAFDVPVFNLPERGEIPADPTLPYHLSLDEIRKQIHSKIRIADLPGGREFIIPHGRNPGFAAGAGIVCVIWAAIVALLLWKHAPLPLPLVFGAMDLFMLYFVFDLWFRRDRIVIAGDTIKIETAWPGHKKESALKISEGVRFFVEVGAPVGHSVYYDLKFQTRDGKELTLAKNLGHKPEAEWLARQMNAAAKNASQPTVNA